MYNTNKRDFFSLVVCLICFITFVGQTPALIDNYETRVIIIPIWLLLLFFCIFIKRGMLYLGEARQVFILFVLFLFIYGIGSMIIEPYSASSLPYVIVLSMFILLCGLLSGHFMERSDLERLNTWAIWAIAIVCIDTFRKYVYGVSLNTTLNAYDTKNSVSQIILTGWILILLFKFNREIPRIKKLVYLGIFLLFTISLFGLRCRATLISIPVILVWIVIHGKMNKQARNIIVLGVIGASIYLALHPNILNLIIDNIIYAGRHSNNLDELSSGRVIEWTNFVDEFRTAPFFGHGRMKRESIILTSLLEFGIIGGGFVLMVAGWPLLWSLRSLRRGDNQYLAVSAIAISYTINGVFEQLAPFGPGVKCYYLWFIVGLLISIRQNEYFDSLYLDSM